MNDYSEDQITDNLEADAILRFPMWSSVTVVDDGVLDAEPVVARGYINGPPVATPDGGLYLQCGLHTTTRSGSPKTRQVFVHADNVLSVTPPSCEGS